MKRTKASRARGTKTHGWGHKKKHRGSGSRGGKGNAGSGKRADSKKPSTWKTHKPGRYGFKTHTTKAIKTITLRDIDKTFAEGKVDLMMYDKVLATGDVTKKFNILVPNFTKKAEEKVKAKGGSISNGQEE